MGYGNDQHEYIALAIYVSGCVCVFDLFPPSFDFAIGLWISGKCRQNSDIIIVKVLPHFGTRILATIVRPINDRRAV